MHECFAVVFLKGTNKKCLPAVSHRNAINGTGFLRETILLSMIIHFIRYVVWVNSEKYGSMSGRECCTVVNI